MRSFALTVAVDQSRAQPIDIVTEPPIEGPALAAFGQWIGNDRRDIKDGTYVLTLGAAEDGVQGTGPHKPSLDLLRRKLVTPMTEAQERLTEAFRFNDLDDETFVTDVAGLAGRAVSLSLAYMKPDGFVPGFLRLKVAGSVDDVDRALLQGDVDRLAAMDLPEGETLRAYRDGLLAKAAKAGVTPRPVADSKEPIRAFLGGIASSNPFAIAANAKLQARVDALLPQIEAALIKGVVAEYAGAHERTGSTLAALRGSFGLT